MSGQRLVLTCGYVSCLKTSLSLAIAPRLAMSILGTYGMGTFSASSPERLERDREVRYRHLFEIANAYLTRGLSLWVDGNFPKRAWRAEIFGLARRYRIGEVAIVRCHCSNPAQLESRFASRRADRSQPDAQADDLSAYYGSIAQFESLLAAELEGLAEWEALDYDSCDRSLGPRSLPRRLGSEISSQMLACGFLRSA